MRRFASLLLLAFVAAAMGGFVVANNTAVTVSLPWSAWEITLPLYLVLFAGILLGVLFMMPVTLWMLARRAMAMRRERRRVDAAEKRLAAIEAERDAARATRTAAHIEHLQESPRKSAS
ncbi:MAG: lipopolysaccharide assembly protein LapA domain-containing protein [Rhodothalassiaceae bacterium]